MSENIDSGRPAAPRVSAPAAAAARAQQARKAKPEPRKLSPAEATVIKVSTVIAVWLGY